MFITDPSGCDGAQNPARSEKYGEKPDLRSWPLGRASIYISIFLPAGK